jgi:hypothetical protein
LSNWIPSCGIVQCEVATATRGRVQLVINIFGYVKEIEYSKE